MNTRRQRLRIDGVLLLDKPAGISSNGALQRVKRLLNAARAGHCGTLDPFATGLLPIALGEATKFSGALTDADKTYETIARLGERTDTGDCEGAVIERRAVSFDDDRLRDSIARLTGTIDQIPPMYSALKRDGRPLYAYARAGETLEREPRRVTVHELSVLAHDHASLALRVRCSKGTYIRTLIEDLGEMLGCGAHAAALRRTTVGRFNVTDAMTLASAEEMPPAELSAWLLPVDAMIADLPEVVVAETVAARFLNGQAIAALVPRSAEDLPPNANIFPMLVRVRDAAGRFIGTAEAREDRLCHPVRVVSVGQP